MASSINKSSKILITGGWGFLGSHLRKELADNGYHNIRRMRKRYCNLISQQQTNTYFRRNRPKVVIHLAGTVGGIGANREHPGQFFYENMQMGLNVLEYAKKYEVEKVVLIGTVCSYPKFTTTPFREMDLWHGYPEETNAPYGIAKRSLMEMARSYNQEYGMNIISLIPVNLYGPHEHFDPNKSHVIPALILKFWLAKVRNHLSVDIWGFLYVKDCALAIRMAMEQYDKPDPVNLGNGREILIRDLVGMISAKMRYGGKLNFDTSKPDGQPRRCLDTRKAKESFGFEAQTSFEDGLQETIRWFERNAHDITRSLGL
jgi:GDP-L-fucose synthase